MAEFTLPDPDLDVNDENEEYFNDGDMADPTYLSETAKYIGIVSVDASKAQPGNFRKFTKPSDDGRTEVPQVTLKITAKGKLTGTKEEPGVEALTGNVMRSAKSDYWIGKKDIIGRNSLYRLLKSSGVVNEEDFKTAPMRELVTKLDGTYVVFGVKLRQGTQGGTFQDARGVRAATAEEVAQVN